MSLISLGSDQVSHCARIVCGREEEGFGNPLSEADREDNEPQEKIRLCRVQVGLRSLWTLRSHEAGR